MSPLSPLSPDSKLESEESEESGTGLGPYGSIENVKDLIQRSYHARDVRQVGRHRFFSKSWKIKALIGRWPAMFANFGRSDEPTYS